MRGEWLWSDARYATAVEHEGKLTSPQTEPDPPQHPVPATTLQRFFLRLQRWADAGWSGSVILGWGLLQGCIFPGLSDLFFLPFALARPQRAYVLALYASVGTIIGSVLLYYAGASALTLLQGPLAEFLGITTEHLDTYRERLGRYGAWAILASTVTPLSTKLTSVASGMVGVPFAYFVGALTVGRVGRTMALAWIIRNGGAEMLEGVIKVKS